jgi:hypothetical protein
VTCDEVRAQLAEHLLGTLDEALDFQVRRHLRGCAGCRTEMAALEEGVATFSRAAHQAEPPEHLKDQVLMVLREEWEEAGDRAEPRRSWTAIAWAAAAVVVLVASLSWGVISHGRATRYEAAALKYETLLNVLGGEDVRVGNLEPVGTQELEGSAVLYDSKVGQSWVLILARAPGMQGTAGVTLSSPAGHTIQMHPLEFAGGGEASSWLVTSSNLKPFDRVTVTGPDGRVLATAAVQAD